MSLTVRTFQNLKYAFSASTICSCRRPARGALARSPCRFVAPPYAGLIVRPLSGDVISICPPLIIEPQEIDELFDRLGRALDLTLDWAKRERLLAA